MGAARDLEELDGLACGRLQLRPPALPHLSGGDVEHIRSRRCIHAPVPEAGLGGDGIRAAFGVFVFFSVMLTVFNGVQSTGAIGAVFLIAFVSIVAFPTAGIVRFLMLVFGKSKAAD